MKMGAPKKKVAERQRNITAVRLRDDERDLVEKAAAFQQQTLSKWMRFVLKASALRQIRRAQEASI